MIEIKPNLSRDEFMDIIKHGRSQFEISVRLDNLFSGYHSLSQLWILNHKRNPKCSDRLKIDYTIPICDKCDHQWGSICFYFENCKQMLGYGVIGTPLFNCLGKSMFAE